MSEYERTALRENLSQVVLVPLGGAGAGFTFTPSGAEYSRIRIVSFRLAADANVANRNVSLSLVHADGQSLCALPAFAAQTAGLTWDYVFGMGLTPYNVTAAAAVVGALPDVWLPAGGSITVAIAGVQVGDAITRGHVVLDQVYALGGE